MKMGVIGAGLMGREIALVHALAGWEVVLADRDQRYLDNALDLLRGLVDKGVKRGLYDPEQGEDALARLQPTTSLEDFADVEVAVEAVFEREDVKAEVWTTLDGLCS